MATGTALENLNKVYLAKIIFIIHYLIVKLVREIMNLISFGKYLE